MTYFYFYVHIYSVMGKGVFNIIHRFKAPLMCPYSESYREPWPNFNQISTGSWQSVHKTWQRRRRCEIGLLFLTCFDVGG